MEGIGGRVWRVGSPLWVCLAAIASVSVVLDVLLNAPLADFFDTRLGVAIRSALPFAVGWPVVLRCIESPDEVIRRFRSWLARPELATALECRYVRALGCAITGSGVVAIALTLLDPWLDGVGAWLDDRGGLPTMYFTAAVTALVVTLVVWTAVRAVAWVIGQWQTPSGAKIETGARRVATVAALTCLLTLGCAALASINPIYGDAARHVDAEGDAVTSGRPTQSMATADPAAILHGLAPVLTLSEDDLQPPVAVDLYLAESSVQPVGGGPAGTPDLSAPPACIGDTPCVVVDNPSCPDSPACELFEWSDDAGSFAGYDERVVAYGRVVRQDDGTADAARVTWDDARWGGQLIGFAQWWLFTPRDSWKRPVLMGLGEATKRHLADWEVVTIGFAADTPLFVAISSHCGGTWMPWDAVDVVLGDSVVDIPLYDALGPNMHVVISRTVGSQGYYFEGDAGRSPDMFGCGKEGTLRRTLRHGRLRGLSYLANVHDETGDFAWVLPRIVYDDAAELVLTYPAYWAVDNEAFVTLLGWSKRLEGGGTIVSPKGPDGPRYKAIYEDPVDAIFHDQRGRWRRA